MVALNSFGFVDQAAVVDCFSVWAEMIAKHGRCVRFKTGTGTTNLARLSMSVLNHSNHPNCGQIWANNISCVTICIQLGVMWEDIRVKTITAGLSCSPSSLAVYPLDGCSQTL